MPSISHLSKPLAKKQTPEAISILKSKKDITVLMIKIREANIYIVLLGKLVDKIHNLYSLIYCISKEVMQNSYKSL